MSLSHRFTLKCSLHVRFVSVLLLSLLTTACAPTEDEVATLTDTTEAPGVTDTSGALPAQDTSASSQQDTTPAPQDDTTPAPQDTMPIEDSSPAIDVGINDMSIDPRACHQSEMSLSHNEQVFDDLDGDGFLDGIGTTDIKVTEWGGASCWSRGVWTLSLESAWAAADASHQAPVMTAAGGQCPTGFDTPFPEPLYFIDGEGFDQGVCVSLSLKEEINSLCVYEWDYYIFC